jgi:hypothetical protein
MNAFRRVAVRRQVIVNLTSGAAFRGILFRQAGPLLVLRNAELLAAGEQPMPIDGEVVIERSRVEFVQIVGS